MKSVLVVEDDEMNRALVAKYLKREGYKVLFAQDGLRGVELAQAETPDLILMDLELPELNGWEATRRIKADPATSHIPVLVLTAHALQTDVIDAANAGCDGYEAKPVSYSRLMEKVNRFLEARN
jgi:two-component system cell cycle response regulator DivK